jgi:enediyne biosynthesis protein E4
MVGAACGGDHPGTVTADPPPPQPAPSFVEVAAASGIDFVHRNGATGELYYPELMQGGAALLDVDGDGFLDVFLVQSGPLPPTRGGAAGDRLWRNRGDGTFEDWTAASGIADDDYGSGAAAADYDGDGDVDLFVSNLGPDRLWRNRGDGRFEDVTAVAGTSDPRYSTSAAFVDYDADGDLDLFVCDYVKWSPRAEKVCLGPMGLRGYCSPGEYEPEPSSLYRNEGDGRFTDVSASSGIGARPSTALGVAAADFDGDGRVDLYVANDQRPNFLWMNNGDGTFREEALERGCALSGLGFPEAGMGVIAADPDADGDWDLFVVNLTGENATYYRNGGDGTFLDVTDEVGLGAVTQPYTGFGTALFDYDGDGWLDVFIANGKVVPGDSVAVLAGSGSSAGGAAVDFDYREPNLLLRGRADGGFEDVSAQAGPAFETLAVSRAAAFGDLDNDGDLDIVVVTNGGPVQLLRNEIGSSRHWLLVRLHDPTTANRDGIGAELTLDAGGRVQRRLVQPAYSYCASNDLRAHFGLDAAAVVDSIDVKWPDGATQRLERIVADQILHVERSVTAVR